MKKILMITVIMLAFTDDENDLIFKDQLYSILLPCHTATTTYLQKMHLYDNKRLYLRNVMSCLEAISSNISVMSDTDKNIAIFLYSKMQDNEQREGLHFIQMRQKLN